MDLQVSLQNVELKSPDVDLKTGLAKSPTLYWLPVAIDSADLLEPLRKEAPIDGREVVEWMHYATAGNAVVEGFEEDYKVCSAGGVARVVGRSGDGYIPGVRVAQIRAQSVPGHVVRRRGYTVVYTPRGSFRVPIGGKSLFANVDVLAWATLPQAWWCQYDIMLLQWLNLAKAPIRKRVRFPSYAGRVAPNFFIISTRVPSPICVMRIGITSDRPQKIIIRGRGTKGSYHKVLFSDSFKVDKGKNEVIYNITGFPAVPNFTLELQPQDNTKTVLDYLDVFP